MANAPVYLPAASDTASTSTLPRTRMRVPAIDGFRGYAAMSVILIHVF